MIKIYKKHLSKYYSELVLLSIIFLFFFQQITDFVESIYLLNLIETEVNENIVAILFLISPIVLLRFKKGISDKSLAYLGEIMVISRILQPFFGTQIKVIISGLGVGCFMIFLPVYLQKKSLEDQNKGGLSLGLGLGFGLSLSIMLRLLGSSLDLSLLFWFQWIGWILAFIASIMLINMQNPNRKRDFNNTTSDKGVIGSKWKILGLSLGMTSIIILCYFVFSSPTVIARWTEVDIIPISVTLIIVFTLFIIFIYLKPDILSKIPSKGILLWNIAFVVLLVLIISINQIPFNLISSYPYYTPDITIINYIFLFPMLVLSPILLFDFILLSKELLGSKPSTRKLGASFFASSLYFIIIIFSAVFTTTWDYIPLIGPIFRDMIWLVFLIIGIIIIGPMLLVKKDTIMFSKITLRNNKRQLKISCLIGIIAFVTILGGIIVESPHINTPENSSTLRILSYNIQQGADDPGNKNFEGQSLVIQGLNPDIIGLIESDLARIANGNSDFVRYISNTLGYYSYYGPKTVTGTFGIALLSKYPIKNSRTFYMECEEEQAATIWAQIDVGTTTFNIFVTHLGNYRNTTTGDRSQIVQQENILSVTQGKENIILMGDFNFQPNTEQYNLTVVQLYDTWELVLNAYPSNAVVDPNLPGGREIPNERIDHIFVSHHLNESMTSAHYTGGFESDHPALFTTLNLTSI